jgi:chitinase
MNGQPGSLSTNDKCSKGKYRNLCCDDGTLMGTCQWRGYRGVGLSCISGCDNGETEVVQDTNHKEKKSDQTCTGGMQSEFSDRRIMIASTYRLKCFEPSLLTSHS